MNVEEFDKIFDEGKEDILQYADLTKVTKPNLELEDVNIQMPIWMIRKLDRKAAQIGISRDSVIKTWIDERIKKEKDL